MWAGAIESPTASLNGRADRHAASWDDGGGRPGERCDERFYGGLHFGRAAVAL